MLYAIVLILGIVPKTVTTVHCPANLRYPPIMMANDVLFAVVYVVCLILHCKNWFIKWDIKDTKEMSAQQKLMNRALQKDKSLFE
jgi:hypothetical protein